MCLRCVRACSLLEFSSASSLSQSTNKKKILSRVLPEVQQAQYLRCWALKLLAKFVAFERCFQCWWICSGHTTGAQTVKSLSFTISACASYIGTRSSSSSSSEVARLSVDFRSPSDSNVGLWIVAVRPGGSKGGLRFQQRIRGEIYEQLILPIHMRPKIGQVDCIGD